LGLDGGNAIPEVIVNYRSSVRGAEETADLSRAATAVVKVVQARVAIGAQDAVRIGQF
jgi:hypothetical protein